MIEQTDTPRAADLPEGTVIEVADGAEPGLWTAGAPHDVIRWMHQDGARAMANATMQHLLDTGRATAVAP